MKIDWKKEAKGAKRIVRILVLLFTTAVAATFGWLFAIIIFAAGAILLWLIRNR